MAVDNIARAMASKNGGGGSGGAVSSVNGQTGTVVLTYSDVDALSNTTVVPTKVSQLTNDSGFIKDENYVHTDNNYTTEDKDKINNIPTKISELENDEHFVKSDTNSLGNYYDKTGTNNLLSAKASKTDLPTKLSQLSNDTNFIVNTVSNLTNYYNTLVTYNKTEVNSLVSNISSLSLQKVDTLPTENISSSTIYLLLKTESTNNIYEQYINLTGTVDGYEMIGTTEINLDNYYDKLEMDILLDRKVGNNELIDINNKIGSEKLDIGNNLSDAVNKLLGLLGAPPKRYGIRINLNDSNPDTRVEYLYDAIGMKPITYNLVSGTFDYGDWGDIWFVKNNRPVMLNYDGTVAYELHNENMMLKLDGTRSDVDNLSFKGNAMSEIPLIWVKRYREGDWDYIVFCEEQFNLDYKAYAHTDKNNNIQPVIYLSAFEGVYDGTRIRSIANNNVTTTLTYTEETVRIQANGVRWDKISYSEYNLITEMCIMISKSTDTQSKFGNGNKQNTIPLRAGTTTGTGRFYGSYQNNKYVKVFYCENLYGNLWKRTHGLMSKKGMVYYKPTPPYHEQGVGYTLVGTVQSVVTTGGYINKMFMTDAGRIASGASGSESSFECDGMWSDDTSDGLGLFGGDYTQGNRCGLLACGLNTPSHVTLNRIGTYLSCK